MSTFYPIAQQQFTQFLKLCVVCDTATIKKQESLANAKVRARQPCWSKTDFDMKLALKVILGHLFCNQLQADKG